MPRLLNGQREQGAPRHVFAYGRVGAVLAAAALALALVLLLLYPRS